METDKGRLWGIDGLRILSMLGVVMLHMVGEGLSDIELFSVGYYITVFVRAIASCSVNCFALISGYCLYNKRIKIRKLLMYHATVLFYLILLMLVKIIINDQKLNASDIIYSFFPLFSNRYWYFSSYFGLYLLMPFLNGYLEKLLVKQGIYFMAVIIFVGTILPVLKDGIGIKFGYSTMWLGICYCIGAVLGKHNILSKMRTKTFVQGGSCVLIISFSIVVFEYLCVNKGLNEEFKFLLLKYNSPVVLVYSICLLELCSRWKIDNKKIQKIIGKLAASAFSVYLIHNNFMMKSYLHIILEDAVDWPAFILFLFIIAFSLQCYIICVIIDIIRFKIFEIVHINRVISKAEKFMKERIEQYILKLL